MKKNREQVRTLFISDVHLGCRFCKADRLLQFLRGIQPETVYLVGDILDGWKMRKGVYWADDYSFIVRRLIGMMKSGTRVVYLAGNHDEFLRNFLPNAFGHLKLCDEAVHETADGRRLLVIHGDLFDITMNATWLYTLGDTAYSAAMWLNALYNRVRRWFGKPYWSLSLMLKRKVKKAINFVGNFEHFIVKHARERHCIGVICGHIHNPIIKNIDGIDYYNCGDWVESCTALVELQDGTLELRSLPEQTSPAIEETHWEELQHDADELALA